MATHVSMGADEDTPLVPPRDADAEEEEESEEADGWCDLGRRERFYVGCAWVALSLLCQSLSWASFKEGRFSAFATLNALSCIFTIISTCTFSGCHSAATNFLGRDRRFAFLFMLSNAALLMVCGYYRVGEVTITYAATLFLASQMWFSLSYIPGGRAAVKKLFSYVLSCCQYLAK